MKRHSASYAFLLEMLWVCGSLAVSACIFVVAFAKAESLSREAKNLNHAVLAAQNAVEYQFSGYGAAAWLPDSRPSGELNEYFFFDTDWQLTTPENQPCFSLILTTVSTPGLLHTAAKINSADETIYRLEGTRCLFPSSTERRQP